MRIVTTILINHHINMSLIRIGRNDFDDDYAHHGIICIDKSTSGSDDHHSMEDLYGSGPFHFHSANASFDKCWLASTFTHCMLRNSCGVIINWIYSSGCTVDGEDNWEVIIRGAVSGFVVKSYQRSFCLFATIITFKILKKYFHIFLVCNICLAVPYSMQWFPLDVGAQPTTS